jgi:hypothetical protein
MNAVNFIRHRSRIEHEYHGRGKQYKRALSHLVRDAKAALVVVRRKIVGYRLPTGEMVCVKTRYPDEAHAIADVLRIQAHGDGHRVPIRAYPCPHCRGWHTTSQQRGAIHITHR